MPAKYTKNDRFVLLDGGRELSRHRSLAAAKRRAADRRLKPRRATIQNAYPKRGESRLFVLFRNGEWIDDAATPA